MPEPEQDWVDGIIPPALGWRVVHRYIGVHSRRIFDDPDACFASDGICRRIYARHPLTEPAFHYRPLTKSDTGPVRTDLDAGHSVSDFGNADAITNAHARSGGSNTQSGAGDGDLGGAPNVVPQDHRDAGRDQALLLPDPDVNPHSDADVSPVWESSSRNLLHQGSSA